MREVQTTTTLAALREAVALGRRGRDVAAVWRSGRLDPRLREEVMVAVAEANSCRLCTMAHRRWALAEGVPASMYDIDDLAAVDPLKINRTALLIAGVAVREGRVSWRGEGCCNLFVGNAERVDDCCA